MKKKYSEFYGEYTHNKTNNKTSFHLTGDVPTNSILYHDSLVALENRINSGSVQEYNEVKEKRVEKLMKKYSGFTL